ncbi:hypothetical protein GCM10007362_34690 [Saccharibacillus endophyticus]|uniref:Uncharacterized protein n=1 Tax=Saccharibacillus endophyticus TaxID=2060666 RepID=A0ABQ2A2D9_9BACL|nr:hypothetical protein GCM10007362_34690 [Saccharibacillus endophyticus]
MGKAVANTRNTINLLRIECLNMALSFSEGTDDSAVGGAAVYLIPHVDLIVDGDRAVGQYSPPNSSFASMLALSF